MGLAGDSNVIISGVLRDRDADADDRLLAARLAGDIVVMDDGIADLLLERLQDPAESEELRSHAAIALGPVLDLCYTDGFDDPGYTPISEATFSRIGDSLRALYADGQLPKGVRRSVLEAAIRAPRDWHQNAVRSAHYSGDPD